MLGQSVALILLAVLLSTPSWSFEARLGHDMGNAAAAKSAASDFFSLSKVTTPWRYRLLGRRDELLGDRTLLNAAAIVSGGLDFSQHHLSLGLGTHFYRVQPDKSTGQAGNFLPAAGFYWHHERFDLEILGSEKLTWVTAVYRVPFVIPIGIASSFEYIESQPYRWSVDALIHLLRYGGLIAGFEPGALATRAGIWLRPVENLSLRSLSRVNLSGQTFFEFSVAYALSDEREQGPLRVSPGHEPREITVSQKAETKLPAFATLVKWGLTPVVALKLSRERNICALDQNSQAILARHRWECRDAK